MGGVPIISDSYRWVSVNGHSLDPLPCYVNGIENDVKNDLAGGDASSRRRHASAFHGFSTSRSRHEPRRRSSPRRGAVNPRGATLTQLATGFGPAHLRKMAT